MPTDNINLRSEEVQEILSNPPRWIVRTGISVIFIVVAGLFVGSYFLKYPDILPATIAVTTENLPAGVMAMTTGKIDTLTVTEKQMVHEGDLLAVIHNTARLEDVMQVKAILCKWDSTTVETQNWASLQLGDIQSAFSTFVKAREDYLHFVFADYHNRKINVIRKQMATQRRLLQKSKQQLSISSQQLDITRQLLAMDSFLLAKRSLSLADYQNSKNSYFAQAQAFESSKMGIDNQEMSILQSEQAIFDLEQARIEEEKSLTVTLNTAKEQLMAQIRSWEQNYLLIAPCSGKTTFTKYWQKNQNVTAGEVLVTIVPACDKHIIGKILLPPKGAGKVRAGQTVNVKLDNYPYLEYGMMKVKINNISLVPIQIGENEKAYMLEVEFPEKLVTTYGKELTFSQEMSGTAEIITDDLRLLDKFLNPIRDVIRR